MWRHSETTINGKKAYVEYRGSRFHLCQVDYSKIERMRNRAETMRRAASMSHNAEIVALLSRAAEEADADAAEMEAELQQQVQYLRF